MSKRVLVLGGTGLVGKALQRANPEWEYFGSTMGDLRNFKEVLEMLRFVKPTAVINLAGKVGGIRQNIMRQAEFLYDNCTMGLNVLEACKKTGVPRVLTSLSTCAWPDMLLKEDDKMTDEDLHHGLPTPTNLGYGYAKRLIHVAHCSYRDQYGLNYSTFAPSNVYGPEDNFDELTSHFVPACIRRFHENKTGKITLWGTGMPRRQQLFVDDLARAIPIVLSKHNDETPLIVAPNESFTIDSMARVIKKITKSKATIAYNGEMEGQLNKDSCNYKFKRMAKDFKFTSFEEGIKKTYKWFNEFMV